MQWPTSYLAILLMMLACHWAQGQDAHAAKYDPLEAKVVDSKPLDLMVADADRKREIPVRIYLPADAKPAAVILFSHGLGGSRENNAYLGKHWSARGYVVVALQHPGSDDSAWRDAPLTKRLAALREAASAENFLLRVKDVPAVLDALASWHKTEQHPLAGRLDLNRVGMSGHSFGAVTTQAVSGQSAARGLVSFTDSRIKAAVAFSPSLPRAGDAKQAFSSVKIPWLLMTGTKDVSIINDTTAASRQEVYPALPPGGKYEIVLDQAEHSAFSERSLPGEKGKRNPNHHRSILALSTAFWDAYLREDQAALSWLEGEGPRTILEGKDRWQRK